MVHSGETGLDTGVLTERRMRHADRLLQRIKVHLGSNTGSSAPFRAPDKAHISLSGRKSQNIHWQEIHVVAYLYILHKNNEQAADL